MAKASKETREYLAAIGRLGGKATGQKKARPHNMNRLNVDAKITQLEQQIADLKKRKKAAALKRKSSRATA